jgi:hypothetical protein
MCSVLNEIAVKDILQKSALDCGMVQLRFCSFQLTQFTYEKLGIVLHFYN